MQAAQHNKMGQAPYFFSRRVIDHIDRLDGSFCQASEGCIHKTHDNLVGTSSAAGRARECVKHIKFWVSC